MEYVGGRSLKQLLKQRMTANNGEADPLPVDQSLAFLIEILPALGYLHELGLLYCDFKPDNVIQVGDALKLIDLGGVRHAGDEDSAIYGTVGFQAPEVATLGPSIASDIFTVGRTLMVLSAEVPGYQGEFETRIPPAEQMPAFAAHDSLYRLLLKCCAPDPNDRFTSAEELRLQMLGVLREVVASATPGVATTASASVLFEAPTVAGDRNSHRQLPRLRPDPSDPQAAWLSRISADDPAQRLEALSAPPSLSAGVLLARGEAALDAGNPKLIDECVRQLLANDPWEWRAVWLAGLRALQSRDFTTAQSSFNAVYGQVPGELAPKLALALACELGGELDIAEGLYRTCASTDASYVTPAAFGLARVRAARNDLQGSLAALELVPSTSRGYPESQRLKAQHLVTLATDAAGLDEAFGALSQARLDPLTDAQYRALLYRRAMTLAEKGPLRMGRGTVTPAMIRDDLVASYLELGRLTENPEVRAGYVDLANSLRPWSLL
jgi:serine/threonine-protein kinase PknG